MQTRCIRESGRTSTPEVHPSQAAGVCTRSGPVVRTGPLSQHPIGNESGEGRGIGPHGLTQRPLGPSFQSDWAAAAVVARLLLFSSAHGPRTARYPAAPSLVSFGILYVMR